MGAGAALLGQPAIVIEEARPAAAEARAGITVSLSNRIEDVEATWRSLAAGGVESPGQSYDFIALWVKQRGIATADQRYVVGSVDGEPIALLPLHRRMKHGARVLTWFPGSHAGCYAPVADLARLEALGPIGRKALWYAMVAQLSGADLVYLRWIPELLGGKAGLFDELGAMLGVETLYRAQFSSWEECDRMQRSKSRRKHDRQQGERLEALGTVGFEEIGNGEATRAVIETMFAQRSARFRAQGIRDCFVRDKLTGFFHAAAAEGSGVAVRLHVLRLDGAIVAVRYNVVEGDRMFCLISSMSDDPAIQIGSPGKQCLLRVMQTVFDEGFTLFDMGGGLTDEKRHWCNVQTVLRHHYVPLTAWGRAVLATHQAMQKVRKAIKANRRMKDLLRAPGQLLHRVAGAKSE